LPQKRRLQRDRAFFDFTFDGSVIVPVSQDTNIVTRRAGLSAENRKPAQVAAAISTKGTFLPEPLSRRAKAPSHAPPLRSDPRWPRLLGRDVDGKQKALSPRRSLDQRQTLRADSARTVKIYDITGKY